MSAPISKRYPINGTHDVREGDEIRFVEYSESGQLRRIDAKVIGQLKGQGALQLKVIRAKGPDAPKVGDETLRNVSHLRECGVARKQR